MSIDRDGIPFVLLPAAAALAFALAQLWVLAALFAGLAAFMVFFFRSPHRTVPEGPGIVVSAADGRVTRVEKKDEGILVSVFLSPLDVHVNRSPVAGVVGSVVRTKGKKKPATSDSASETNERNSLSIRGDGIEIVCTQIVGILARRIVCRCKPGDSLERGEIFGLIRFGSRTDLLMPADVRICVKAGDRVRGGETVIARYGPGLDQD